MSPEPMILKTYMLGPWGESLRDSAMVIQKVLSSLIVQHICEGLISNFMYGLISLSILINGITSLVDCDKAMYSASAVDKAISV